MVAKQVLCAIVALVVLCVASQVGASTVDIDQLDGSNGFVVSPGPDTTVTWTSVEAIGSVGDINGDGIDDFGLVAQHRVSGEWQAGAYVFYGSREGYQNPFEGFNQWYDATNSSAGFRITFGTTGAIYMQGVTRAGDINGDGLDDLVAWTWRDNSGSGRACVIFGSLTGFPKDVNCAIPLDPPSLGLRINGVSGLRLGSQRNSVAAAGDVNGDGIDDLILGAPEGNGAAYVVYGQPNFPADLSVASLDGTNGFTMRGKVSAARFGDMVRGGGDINGDGLSDFLVNVHHGNTYVVLGSSSFPASFTEDELASYLDGNKGFIVPSNTRAAGFVDINGDGIDDVMLSFGSSLVIFGRQGAFDPIYTYSASSPAWDGVNGFRYTFGIQAGAMAVAAGDINGDGVSDVVIGATYSGIVSNGGVVFVVYGMRGDFPPEVSLDALNGTNGYYVWGEVAGKRIGWDAACADVNGDGLSDVLIGQYYYRYDSSYGDVVIFGKRAVCPDGTTINADGETCDCVVAGASLNTAGDACECDATGASINSAGDACECDDAGALFNAAGDACESTCSDGAMNQNETGVDCGGSACDPCPSAIFTPFGAAMTAPLLGACPTSESNPATEAAWAAPEWGRCWSSTITATKSTGMIDANNDWAATLSLTDGLGTNYYVTAGGATTTWTIYWREQDLTPTNGGYSQDITITVIETIAAASSSATDKESQVFTVTLARDLFGSVSSATDAGVEELVSFANARMHRVEGAVSAVYYAALTFIASGGTIDVDITEVTAKGTAATWPKLAAASMTSYNPCPLSGAVDIAGNPYPSEALDADCAPSLDLCSTDTTTASRVDVYIPLDLGTTFDTASHSVTLVMVVKDAQSNNFQEFYISISPSNGFVTWCDSNLAGVGAPDPKDVLSVDFHVGLSDSPATTVTDGERAELASGSAFSRTGSIIALTASAKGGHDIRLEEVKVFWDFDGSVTPDYGVSYSATDGAGQLTAQHSSACSSLVCKEVSATASGQESLFHTYATDLAAKDFIQPSPRTSEVDTLLGAYLSRITVPSEGTLHNTYLVDPTVELSSPVATVYVFALFKIVQQDGSARRMLLQQAGPTSRGSDGAASAAVRFDVTPAAFAAYTLDISPELVTSWNLQLQTSEADACLPSEQLLQNVRTHLLVHLSSAATALRDVQIVSLTVNKAGVSCSASRPQRRRKLLAPAVASPFVTVEALFIFDDAEAAKPAVDIAKLQAAPGVLSVLQTQSSSATSAVDIIGAASPQAPAPLPASSDSSSPSALHLTLAAAAGAALVVAVLGVLAWVRRKAARRSLTEVQAVALNLTSQTVNMDKIQIECGQRAPPIDDAATTAVATTTVKLAPGPMETLASLSEARPGSRPVLPRADSQKRLLQSN